MKQVCYDIKKPQDLFPYKDHDVEAGSVQIYNPLKSRDNWSDENHSYLSSWDGVLCRLESIDSLQKSFII